MNSLLMKQEIDKNITKTQFLEDLNCLFTNLKELYGMYDYFGDTKFKAAKQAVEERLEQEFDFDTALAALKEELSFVKDGHFYIGEAVESAPIHGTINYTSYRGIPVIECKKFYYDSKEDEQQLITFAESGEKYRDEKSLILDFRGNRGGSSVYIFDFLEGLLGQEVGYPCKYLQRSTELYHDYLKMTHIDWVPELHDTVEEEHCPRIKNAKRIYVLIDKLTASAAEEGVAVLKNIENVTTVGDHTAGRASCGNCLPIYMPNSHFKAYFGTGLVLYEGDRNIDAEGGFFGDISFETFEKMLEEE
uniref:S41 family peptidase n=1 Tax=Roseburia sp. TaxID=2049040 RepID=UPI003FEE9E2C